jgi:hypothetical protein
MHGGWGGEREERYLGNDTQELLNSAFDLRARVLFEEGGIVVVNPPHTHVLEYLMSNGL